VLRLRELSAIVHGIAPRELADRWHNVASQLGDLAARIKKTLLTADATSRMIQRVKRLGADQLSGIIR
jgi:putative NIF3 family GTP cyclohydrolase 1 type 2